jgi:hypothetical protein
MGTGSKIVLPFAREDDNYSGEERFARLLEMREWCLNNLKGTWRTYQINSGGGVSRGFVVFEFEDKKDEMLFRLYTGT